MEQVLFKAGGIAITLGHLLIMAAVAVLTALLCWALGRSNNKSGLPPAKSGARRLASDDAFLKGLTHLMADHTDQAIEEFSKAVTLNSDTVETYVVLGNLFRQKGEIDRAVRIRQNIIARPNLDPDVRLQALYDLGLDYRKGGLFNRAAEIFADVLASDPKHVDALKQVVSLYEEMRDWENAFDSLKKLDRLTGEDHRNVLSHYKTERGKEMMAQGQMDRAEDFLNQAVSVYKGCMDAYLHLGDLSLARGRSKKALGIWRKAVKVDPRYVHLVISRLAKAEEELGQEVVKEFLAGIDADAAEVSTLLSLAEYYRQHHQEEEALELLDLAVQKSPAHLGAHRLRGEILVERGPGQQQIHAYQELLSQIDGEWASYQCSQCGFLTQQLTWKCPRCLQWDVMVPPEPNG